MSFVLEFPDSELRDVVADGALVRLRFSAAAVRNDQGERGWLTSVRLDLGAAAWHGDRSNAVGRISEARFSQGGHKMSPLSVPGSLTGELQLALRLANGTQFVLSCSSIDASIDDDDHFTEDLSC